MGSLESLSVITPLTVCCADNEKGNTKNKIIEKKMSFIKIKIYLFGKKTPIVMN